MRSRLIRRYSAHIPSSRQKARSTIGTALQPHGLGGRAFPPCHISRVQILVRLVRDSDTNRPICTLIVRVALPGARNGAPSLRNGARMLPPGWRSSIRCDKYRALNAQGATMCPAQGRSQWAHRGIVREAVRILPTDLSLFLVSRHIAQYTATRKDNRRRCLRRPLRRCHDAARARYAFHRSLFSSNTGLAIPSVDDAQRASTLRSG